ncbi:MAG: outer membrane beta-barrel protein, partial [Bacteroides sp.]|nr:outer membrane beta-barrel protein [Bacteroides sp.]
FSSFSAKFNINANLNYSFVNNGIERYSFMNNGVQENTYANIGHAKHTRLSLWMNWNPGNKTRISLNAGGMYSDYRSDKAELHTSNHGFQGDLFASIQQTLPWDLRFSINGGMSSPNISLQGEGSGFSFYGFNLSRSFLKEKRLTVSFRASNLFNKYNTFKSETNTSTFRSWSESKISQRSFGVNVSWRFGELKAQVKKVSRSISNDDVKSGGGNSTGGGTSAQ